MSTEVQDTSSMQEPKVTILKSTNCPSLSGKSSLGYDIGLTEGKVVADPDVVQLRLTSNSGSGMFSAAWLSLASILSAFGKAPEKETITAFLLHPLYKGKSINSPSFMFAVLKNEGLVQQASDDKRRYTRLDPAAFIERVQALIDGPTKSASPPTPATSSNGEPQSAPANVPVDIPVFTPKAPAKKTAKATSAKTVNKGKR